MSVKRTRTAAGLAGAPGLESTGDVVMNTVYHLPMRARLEPLTPWRGGRMSETAVLTLKEAARFASKHANTKIKPADFLRAAGLGEIVLRAICPRTVTMQPCRETDEPLAVPENSIPTLPLDACKAIANTGLAQWRTYEGLEPVAAFGGELCRFTRWQLPDEESDLLTTPAECRVLGRDVHALADAFIDMPSVPATTPAAEAPLDTGKGNKEAVPLEHWKMQVQAEAGKRWRTQRKLDCNPTPYSLKDELAKWCKEEDIRTTSNINPTAEYLYRHVLSSKHWTPPAGD